MKAASAGLIAHLSGARSFSIEDRIEFTLASGTVETMSTRRAVATQPIIKRGPIRTKIGVEAAVMSVTMLVDTSSLIDAAPAISYALGGGLDGATLESRRYFLTDAGAEVGSLNSFAGRVSEVDCEGGKIQIACLSDLEILNQRLPRNLFAAGCIHALYDSGCAVSAAAFTVTGTIASGTTVSSITCNLTAQAAGYFDLGVIEFTTGALAGLRRSVKSHPSSGVLVPVPRLPAVPANGDQFTAKPGCDKLSATCETKFSNLLNYRGFEFIPVPEAAY